MIYCVASMGHSPSCLPRWPYRRIPATRTYLFRNRCAGRSLLPEHVAVPIVEAQSIPSGVSSSRHSCCIKYGVVSIGVLKVNVVCGFLSGLATASISPSALGGACLRRSSVGRVVLAAAAATIVAASPSRPPLTAQRKPCQAIPLFRLSDPAPLCFVYLVYFKKKFLFG